MSEPPESRLGREDLCRIFGGGMRIFRRRSALGAPTEKEHYDWDEEDGLRVAAFCLSRLGWSDRAISRQLKVCRRTVRRWRTLVQESL